MPKLTIAAKKSPRLQVMMGELPHRPATPSTPVTEIGNVADLISTDPHNDLKLGSDEKLLVQASNSVINRYSHNQSAPATQWTVNHNLGVQPQISVLSRGGMLMLAEILHTSLNQAIIYFDNPTAGIANCL